MSARTVNLWMTTHKERTDNMEVNPAHAETLANIRCLMPELRARDEVQPLTKVQRVCYARLMITLNLWNSHLPVIPPLNSD